MTILLLMLMAASIALFITKAAHPSAYWTGLVLLGWFLSMSGLILFIAKYGGFYYRINSVLFFSEYIRNLLLYSPISIDTISRLITVGRSLFIYSLTGLSITLLYYRPFRQIWKLYLLNTILPVANIVFYDPIVYRWSLGIIEPEWTYVIGWLTRGWLIVSGLVSIVFMLWRYRRITIPWLKKQVKYILLGVFALTLFYFYLGFLGPLQVTDIRTYYVLYSDFTNYNPPLTVTEWYIGIIVTGILSLVSIVSIWRYTAVEKKLGKPDLHLARKLNIANMGSRVFTHAIKNQLLMMQLLVNKTRSLAKAPDAPASPAEMADNLERMSAIVGETLQRLDQLYNSFKTTYLQLKPVQAHVLFNNTVDRLQIPVRINFLAVKSPENPMILADEAHFVEAIANIVINAFEAIGKDRDGQVTLRMYVEANWLIITIQDNGPGIKTEHLDIIFDPFFTSKNTNKNWGVGLSYVKQIVHGHFGHIHVNSTTGIGSTFQVLVPIYLNAER